MILLNYTHPLTDQQLAQLKALLDVPVDEIRTIPVQINQEEPLAPQVAALADAPGLSNEEWQTQILLINPPAYAPVAFVLLAEIHGRCGHFPLLLRIRPRHGVTTTYEIAEILNLQMTRDEARTRRQS